jgi:hypothetical protein
MEQTHLATFSQLNKWYCSVFDKTGWIILGILKGHDGKADFYLDKLDKLEIALDAKINATQSPDKKQDLAIMLNNIQLFKQSIVQIIKPQDHKTIIPKSQASPRNNLSAPYNQQRSNQSTPLTRQQQLSQLNQQQLSQINQQQLSQLNQQQIGQSQIGQNQLARSLLPQTQYPRSVTSAGQLPQQLTQNGLTQNGLTQNGLTQNGLTQTGLAQTGFNQGTIPNQLLGLNSNAR